MCLYCLYAIKQVFKLTAQTKCKELIRDFLLDNKVAVKRQFTLNLRLIFSTY